MYGVPLVRFGMTAVVGAGEPVTVVVASGVPPVYGVTV